MVLFLVLKQAILFSCLGMQPMFSPGHNDLLMDQLFSDAFGSHMQGLDDATRARDGYQRVPMMNGIGRAVFVNNLQEEEVIRAAHYVASLHTESERELANIVPRSSDVAQQLAALSA